VLTYLLSARGGAFWVAASTNWWLNRHFTFASTETSNTLQQWCRFIALSCVGFIPNWGCYWLLMQHVDVGLLFAESQRFSLLPLAPLWPFMAMLPGILLGMCSNYLLASRWAFKSEAM